MSQTLEYFFDYVSPYSYLGDSQIPGLVERTGCELVHRPFFLGGVMNASGNSPPATVPAKGKYMFADISRWLAQGARMPSRRARWDNACINIQCL